MQAQIKSVLGFDFGTHRIGVAAGQSLTGTAIALETIKAQDGIPHWVALEKAMDEWQPDCLVVGLPLNMDGTIAEMSRRARKFANRLHARFNRPCYLMDERLSSREAKQLHFLAGGSAHFRQDPVDSIAARLILESWFQTQQLIPSHTPLESLYVSGQS